MKPIFLLMIAGLLLAACTKENTPDDVIAPPPPIDTTVSKVLYSGNFQNGPFGTTMGVVKVIETGGKTELRFERFQVSSGPDLKVYLAKEQQPLNFLRLGNLKGLMGDQAYEVPAGTNLADYPYALVHCERFNHLFGSAMLNKQ